MTAVSRSAVKGTYIPFAYHKVLRSHLNFFAIPSCYELTLDSGLRLYFLGEDDRKRKQLSHALTDWVQNHRRYYRRTEQFRNQSAYERLSRREKELQHLASPTSERNARMRNFHWVFLPLNPCSVKAWDGFKGNFKATRRRTQVSSLFTGCSPLLVWNAPSSFRLHTNLMFQIR